MENSQNIFSDLSVALQLLGFRISTETLYLVFDILLFSVWISHEIFFLVFEILFIT